MNPLVKLALELQTYFEKMNWKFCFIGGFALQHWGQPRMTKDVDVSLLSGFGSEEVYIDLLIQDFTPRVPGLKEFALRSRILLLQSDSGIPFDVSLGAIPYEELAVERSVLVDYGAPEKIRICSADDLIIFKAFAARERDWEDIRTVIIRQRNLINWDYIQMELNPLCELKEDSEIVPKLLKLRDKVEEEE